VSLVFPWYLEIKLEIEGNMDVTSLTVMIRGVTLVRIADLNIVGKVYKSTITLF